MSAPEREWGVRYGATVHRASGEDAARRIARATPGTLVARAVTPWQEES